MMIEHEGVEILSESQCLQLLGQERVGRVVVTISTLPAVFPVNYCVVGDEILFFTGEGTKLRAAAANAVVAFEVDHIDPFTESGWSVLVLGTMREVDEPVIIAGARRAGIRPWAKGDRPHLIALSCELVSGRSVAPAAAATDRPTDPVLAAATGMTAPGSPVSLVARRPVRVGSDWSLQETADAMREADVSCVLVDGDTAVATERDLTRALSAGLTPDAPVGAVSVTDLVSVDAETSVVDAAGEMLRHEIRHLLITNHRGGVVGMVSLRDLMHVLLAAMDPAVWIVLRQRLTVRSSSSLFD